MKKIFIIFVSVLLLTSALFAEQRVKYEKPIFNISSITHLLADECNALVAKGYSIVTVSGDEKSGYMIVYDTASSTKKQHVVYEKVWMSISSITHVLADECTKLINKGYTIVAVSADESSGYMIVYE